MALTDGSTARDVGGITPAQRAEIQAFIQGAVYSRIVSRPFEWFFVRDLAGGENSDWNGTPLQALYDKHVGLGRGHEAAMDEAGKDLGWIVKSVLIADRRYFEPDRSAYVNRYRWIQPGVCGTAPTAEPGAPAQ